MFSYSVLELISKWFLCGWLWTCCTTPG